jgi:tRNA (guanine37-N1)-methyltransferase
MPKKSQCLRVPKKEGEKAIRLVHMLKIIDNELEVQRNSSHIYIPLNRNPSQEESEILKRNITNTEVIDYIFPFREKQKTFLELLEGKLPPYLLASIPKSMDIIGDIATIEIPPELEPYKNDLGCAILQAHKGIRTVLAKASAITGTYRLREFTFIAGEPKTETIHKEHGCKYYIDLAKVYFSPRLSYEHSRVASLVKENETVVDMFAGVGPFSILIAKTHENVRVYAIDINPSAFELLKKNIRLNRVENKVHPILGDAKQVAKDRLKGIADRVIMNLPEKAVEFLDAACETLKPEGGTIHFYTFAKASNSIENLKIRLQEEIEKAGRKVKKFLFSRSVRETAPYEWQIVLDVEVL